MHTHMSIAVPAQVLWIYHHVRLRSTRACLESCLDASLPGQFILAMTTPTVS